MYRHHILSLSGLDPSRYPLHQDKLAALKASGEIMTPDGSLPHGETPSAIGSFIRGYLAADGHLGRLATPDKEFYDFFIDNHGYAGLVLTGSERTVRRFITVDRMTKFYDDYEMTYAKGAEFKGFRVARIEGPSTEYEQLYGVYMPDNGDYVINGGWTVRGD